MSDSAHDVCLMSLLVNGVAHGFSVNGQSVVIFAIFLIPFLDCLIDMRRLDAYQDIADGIEARHDIFVVLISAAKAHPGFFLETLRPVGDGLIAAHAAQGSPSGNG